MRLFTQRMDTVVETTLRLPAAEDERRVGFGFAEQIRSQVDQILPLLMFCKTEERFVPVGLRWETVCAC